MDGPLLDLADPAVKRMIKLAKKRGYVTHDELDAVLPVDVFSPEQIEDVLEQLSEMSISVVEVAPEDLGDLYRELANELRSFASGQRGDGRKLLERAATALDREADCCWSPDLPDASTRPAADRWQARFGVPSRSEWVLVFDQRLGVQIAARHPSGAWIGQNQQTLEHVALWRPLPLPPSAPAA